MELRTAQLTAAEVTRLLAAEIQIGVRLLALKPFRALAELDERQRSAIRNCEAETGLLLLAHSPHTGPLSEAAPLTMEEVGRLRRYEEELGYVLVAHRDPAMETSLSWSIPEPAELAPLTPDQELAVKALERELAVILLAYAT